MIYMNMTISIPCTVLHVCPQLFCHITRYINKYLLVHSHSSRVTSVCSRVLWIISNFIPKIYVHILSKCMYQCEEVYYFLFSLQCLNKMSICKIKCGFTCRNKNRIYNIFSYCLFYNFLHVYNVFKINNM